MSLDFSHTYVGQEAALVNLFTASFTTSDGPEEGALVGDFAQGLLNRTSTDDLRVVSAFQDGHRVGAIVFSRLWYADEERVAFLLSPVAVATEQQHRGIGQALLTHGIDALRDEGVAFIATYGDPAYYGKVGFEPITKSIARPPMPLSHPHGWLGQFLGPDTRPMRGACTCVPAAARRDIW